MSAKNKTNKAAEAAALLNKNLEDAQIAFDGLAQDASQEDKDAAQVALDAAKKAIEDVNGTKVEVEFILSPTGKFGLGYNPSEVGEFGAIQANELVDAGYAKFVK